MKLQDFIRNFLDVGLVINQINIYDYNSKQPRLMLITDKLDYYQDTDHIDYTGIQSFDVDHINQSLNIYLMFRNYEY